MLYAGATTRKGVGVAQKVQVLLVDDLDGGEADETVAFALDGAAYEIDLSRKNADSLQDAVSKYVAAARKARRAAASARQSGARRAAARRAPCRGRPQTSDC